MSTTAGVKFRLLSEARLIPCVVDGRCMRFIARATAHLALVLMGISARSDEIAAQQPALWRLIPEVRIEHPFRDINGVVIAPDSSVIIADRMSREINVFKRGGAHVRRVGGERGIIAFDQIRGIGLLSDTLWVMRVLRTCTLSKANGWPVSVPTAVLF